LFFSKDIWYNMKIFYTVVIDNLNMIFVKMSLKLCRFFLDLIENKTLSIINLVLLENITSSLLMSLIKSVESDNCIHFAFIIFKFEKYCLYLRKVYIVALSAKHISSLLMLDSFIVWCKSMLSSWKGINI